MYALITPTFDGHLFFIEKYLKSLDTYLLDKEVPIYFTIEESSVDALYNIASKYSSLNVNILSFDDLLHSRNIKDTPSELLKKYGKFSYQTIKKFLTVESIPERYSLVIDSESMMVKSSKIADLIDSFISEPFLIFSKLSERSLTSPFLKKVINHTADLLSIKPDEYFLEHFVWVYDKEILADLVNEYGSVISLINKAQRKGGENVFEIQTYLAYIFKNNEKYNYKLINAIEQVGNIDKKYLDSFYEIYNGNFGVLEMAGSLVTKDNYEKFACMFRELNLTMIRSEYYGRMKYHNKFIKLVSPSFLCSSQEHSFGLNDTRLNRLLDTTDTRWEYNIIRWQLDVLKIKVMFSLAYRLIRVMVKIPCNFLLNKFR